MLFLDLQHQMKHIFQTKLKHLILNVFKYYIKNSQLINSISRVLQKILKYSMAPLFQHFFCRKQLFYQLLFFKLNKALLPEKLSIAPALFKDGLSL